MKRRFVVRIYNREFLREVIKEADSPLMVSEFSLPTLYHMRMSAVNGKARAYPVYRLFVTLLKPIVAAVFGTGKCSNCSRR